MAAQYKALCNFTCLIDGASKQIKKDELISDTSVTQDWLANSTANGFLVKVADKEEVKGDKKVEKKVEYKFNFNKKK